MALTPMDINNKEFKSARFGGYNEEDVDSFLDLIADDLEKMTMEKDSMVEELEKVKKKLAEFEEMQSSLQSALITASKSAEDVKEQSKREAAELLTNARKESDLRRVLPTEWTYSVRSKAGTFLGVFPWKKHLCN